MHKKFDLNMIKSKYCKSKYSWVDRFIIEKKFKKTIKKLIGGGIFYYNTKYFKLLIPIEQISGNSVKIHVKVCDKSTEILINGYKNKKVYYLNNGSQCLEVEKQNLEYGENIIAYHGKCLFENIEFDTFEGNMIKDRELENQNISVNNIDRAVKYLVSSVISSPNESNSKGSTYTIYDYDNECFRKPYWFWSDAPVVSALLEISQRSKNEKKKKYFENRAKNIGESLLANRVLLNNFKIPISRYRIYNKKKDPFACLIGPNDASFIIKWAFLPLYKHTGDATYLEASKEVGNWLIDIINEFSFIPSHYYNTYEYWEKGAFIDTGFITEGLYELSKYDLNNINKYKYLTEKCTDTYIENFKIRNGLYGHYYKEGKGTGKYIFARGLAWALEGLIASYKFTTKRKYLEEAINIADILVENQNPNGSWSYFLGKDKIKISYKSKSGECEKATTVLAYMLLELYEQFPRDKYHNSSLMALQWCEKNIVTDISSEGYGGIASRNLKSGITDLPFLKIATNYANAFYVLAKLKNIKTC